MCWLFELVLLIAFPFLINKQQQIYDLYHTTFVTIVAYDWQA